MERLQRVLSNRGAGSRRTAEQLILDGRVSVNGQVVTTLGTRVDRATAVIHVDGKLLRPPRRRVILLNKPSGYITTMRDERGRWTVMELINSRERVFPVGRLDRDTEGLLLLTNDGDLANRIMHPRYRIAKEYHVVTLKRPHDGTMQRVRAGVRIDGRLVVPDEFRILRETREGIILKLVIHEGFYHAVRRIMESVGIQVHKLRRFRVGPISIRGVPPGASRELTPGEDAQLTEAVRIGAEEALLASDGSTGSPSAAERAPRQAGSGTGVRKPHKTRSGATERPEGSRSTTPARKTPHRAGPRQPGKGANQSPTRSTPPRARRRRKL